VLKLTMPGDVFDGRGFQVRDVGQGGRRQEQAQNFSFDVDLRLGTVAGYYGETVRAVDVKLSRRNGSIRVSRSAASSGAIRR
jgi:hypothetical protein